MMLTAFDYVLIFAALAALIGLPLMVIRSLWFARQPERGAATNAGQLSTSKASLWAAAFCLIAPLGAFMRYRAGLGEPDFAWTNSGPAAALFFAVFATLVALFLAWRWNRRRGRFDADRLVWKGRVYPWSDLQSIRIVTGEPHFGLSARSAPAKLFTPAQTVLNFGANGEVVLQADIVGRQALNSFAKRLAANRSIPVEDVAPIASS